MEDIIILVDSLPWTILKPFCDVIYNKKEAVTIMTAVPLSSGFTYRITSVSDQGEVIECNVSVDGLGQTDVQFTFVLNKHHLKLESAGFFACPTAPTPSRRHFAGWKNHLTPAFEDSNTVISEFLKTLEQTLASLEFHRVLRHLRAERECSLRMSHASSGLFCVFDS
ncbi:unnamed protein product [Caenorhabditis brenneri]